MTIHAAFIGILSKDPELRQGKSGKPYANFSCTVASEGDPQWINVICFGDLAENIAKDAKRGDKVFVEGAIRLASWTDGEGQPKSGLAVSATKAERVFANKVYRDSYRPPKAMSNDTPTFPIAFPARKKRKSAFALFRKAKKTPAPGEPVPFNDELPF